ncbi:hypothetical protein HaLaN_18881 [Haematococcus lacustris]|uniref:Uncharacterized protein n=1 Tax=Haematococcus lacustris TaxID=44745 RepID=A0A699ZZF5_HAELA|nr:hypothetical protein HaLaN_18881 [Haematococcus lacustris]
MAKLHSTKDHLVPAAMLSTRGPVTGDHLQTFHHFQAYMKDQLALYQWYEDQTGWAATSDPGPAPAASSQPIAEAAGVRAGAGGPAGASLTPSSATGPQANTAEPPGGEEDEEATAATTPAPSAVGKRGGRGGKTPGGKTPGGRAPGGKTPGTAGRVLRTRKPLQPLPGGCLQLLKVA